MLCWSDLDEMIPSLFGLRMRWACCCLPGVSSPPITHWTLRAFIDENWLNRDSEDDNIVPAERIADLVEILENDHLMQVLILEGWMLKEINVLQAKKYFDIVVSEINKGAIQRKNVAAKHIPWVFRLCNRLHMALSDRLALVFKLSEPENQKDFINKLCGAQEVAKEIQKGNDPDLIHLFYTKRLWGDAAILLVDHDFAEEKNSNPPILRYDALSFQGKIKLLQRMLISTKSQINTLENFFRNLSQDQHFNFVKQLMIDNKLSQDVVFKKMIHSILTGQCEWFAKPDQKFIPEPIYRFMASFYIDADMDSELLKPDRLPEMISALLETTYPFSSEICAKAMRKLMQEVENRIKIAAISNHSSEAGKILHKKWGLFINDAWSNRHRTPSQELSSIIKIAKDANIDERTLQWMELLLRLYSYKDNNQNIMRYEQEQQILFQRQAQQYEQDRSDKSDLKRRAAGGEIIFITRQRIEELWGNNQTELENTITFFRKQGVEIVDGNDKNRKAAVIEMQTRYSNALNNVG